MKKKTSPRQKTKKLIHTKEFWTGILITIAAVIAFTLHLLNPDLTLNEVSNMQESISPTPQAITAITQIKNKEVSPSSIEVIEGDNFWKISERACKTGKYYLVIQDLNLSDPYFDGLHAGDTVKIKCSFE